MYGHLWDGFTLSPLNLETGELFGAKRAEMAPSSPALHCESDPLPGVRTRTGATKIWDLCRILMEP
jgi:hypothetical protein